jgi:hypothetical protein
LILLTSKVNSLNEDRDVEVAPSKAPNRPAIGYNRTFSYTEPGDIGEQRADKIAVRQKADAASVVPTTAIA